MIFCRGLSLILLRNSEWVRTMVAFSRSSCFPAHLRLRAATFGENQTALPGGDDGNDDDHVRDSTGPVYGNTGWHLVVLGQ